MTTVWGRKLTGHSPAPLHELTAHRVSIWLDNISRDKITDGSLKALIVTRSVGGVTSNPTIFEQAIAGSTIYDKQLADLALRRTGADEAARLLIAQDIRDACDIFAGVFEATNGADGRVSIEVDPRAASDTQRTLAEARALWWLVDRPNALVKIPATAAGLEAIAQATAEGISVNVTLIFSLTRYRQVMDAYLDGLERAAQSGKELSQIRSVASFFVSRVDSEVDSRLEGCNPERVHGLRGLAGTANARLAYEAYRVVFSDSNPRWVALRASGANAQRPLWASTGVKNPAYPDTMYVDGLVGPDVINTMPDATLEAVADHAVIAANPTILEHAHAHQVMADLKAVGIDFDDVVDELERQGVAKFVQSWELLLERLQRRLDAASTSLPHESSAP